MSKDEEVDGAAVAALILSYMPRPQRERILKEMQKASPRSTAKVKKSLLDLALGQDRDNDNARCLPTPAEDPSLQPNQIATALQRMMAEDSDRELRPARRIVTKRVGDAYPTETRTSSRTKTTK